jgi:hypothetical protein
MKEGGAGGERRFTEARDSHGGQLAAASGEAASTGSGATNEGSVVDPELVATISIPSTSFSPP